MIVYNANLEEEEKALDEGEIELFNELEMQQKFIKDIFFRVYEGAEETLIYDQLEESNKQGVSIGD